VTPAEFAGKKRKIAVIAGIGIFALLCSVTFAFIVPDSRQNAILLVAIFLICMFVAWRLALRLKKEIAQK
jgi:hypothetical protein